ncbi:MAG: hypothetical protein M3Y87_08600 [Myxococcota bacterium]|nr:hypothetical protein [Myxococcota bacterium]
MSPIRDALPPRRAARLPGRAVVALLIGVAALGCGRGRDPGTIECTPGEALLVGCSSACGVGSCSGDPVLRVCDGSIDSRACADALAILGESDDSCETLCPSTRVVCPASGRITVVHRAFREGAYTCDWSVAPSAAPATLRATGDAGRAREL